MIPKKQLSNFYILFFSISQVKQAKTHYWSHDIKKF